MVEAGNRIVFNRGFLHPYNYYNKIFTYEYGGSWLTEEIRTWLRLHIPDATYERDYINIRSYGDGNRGGWKRRQNNFVLIFPDEGSLMLFTMAWLK